MTADIASLITALMTVAVGVMVALISARIGYRKALEDAEGQARQAFQIKLSEMRIERKEAGVPGERK